MMKFILILAFLFIFSYKSSEIHKSIQSLEEIDSETTEEAISALIESVKVMQRSLLSLYGTTAGSLMVIFVFL